MKPIIMRNVKKKVSDQFTLGPIQMELEPGSITALVGNNGAGKSSLFRLVAGLIKQDEGEINRFGNHENWKAELAYMPQQLNGSEFFTLNQLEELQQLAFPEWDQSEFARLIEQFELPRTTLLSKLSSGMQKKALFALLIPRSSKLLLLDEPFAGLDLRGQEQIENELLAYMERSEEQRVVFATHSADEVQRLADYIYLLEKGAAVGNYEKDQLLTSWKRVWLQGDQREELDSLHGVIQVTYEHELTELFTSNYEKTEQALSQARIPLYRTETLSLADILRLMLQVEKSKAKNH